MRYLIQNRKEFAITVLLFIVYAIVLVWAVWSIVHNEFDITNFVSIVASIISCFAWYFNIPTSEENCRHTGEMRQEKAEKEDGYVGEVMFEEADDDDI